MHGHGVTHLRGVVGAAILLFATLSSPALLHAQGLGQLALSTLPDDTRQLTYTNLRQLRNLPEYPSIRQQVVGRGLQDLSDSLLPAGENPEQNTDEVVLAWRGAAIDPSRFFGLAGGHFHARQVLNFFQRRGAHAIDYAGSKMYPLRSSAVRAEVYFTFLDGSLAAFGRPDDLKAVLDVRAGSRPALDTNSSVVGWESELEGSAPEWGISTGKAATSQAANWLMGGVNPPASLGAVMAPVQAVLYSFDLTSGLTARISVVCDRPETAAALAQILLAWRSSQPAAGKSSPDLATFLASLNITSNGPRVEVDGSGPLDLLQQLSH